MKLLHIILLLLVSLLLFPAFSKAQTINWASLQPEQKHIVTINAGFEHGLVAGLGYGYRLNTKLPLILSAEHSFPAGSHLFEDFKTKVGGQLRVAKIGNFALSTKIHGVFRRYENNIVRMINFGSELTGIAGYYRPKWFVAAEFGFDKAIVTHFSHSVAYKENYPMVQDGWYEPATGGNFSYGLQIGYSFRKSELYLKTGQVVNQDFRTKPFVPYYLQVGYNVKFNGRK